MVRVAPFFVVIFVLYIGGCYVNRDVSTNRRTDTPAIDESINTGKADADNDSSLNKENEAELDSDTDACQGCVIDEECFRVGYRNPANVCEICDPSISLSSWSPKDGDICEDGNPCTIGEKCQSGECTVGKPFNCSALDDQCRIGVCDPKDGACIVEPANEDDLCEDGNLCTAGETCQSGKCAGGEPVDCSTLNNQCRIGVCDPAQGACVTEPANEGDSCEDGDLCTTGETCQSGECTGGEPVDCSALDSQCRVGVCDPTQGACVTEPANEGDSCEDRNPCTTGETCQSGACTGGEPVFCPALDDQCRIGVCDPTQGACIAEPANEGESCQDGDRCTTGETCRSGACTGGETVDCTALDDQCRIGVCDPTQGTCVAEPANEDESCQDGNRCTLGETCRSGACTGGESIDCYELNNACNRGVCNPENGRCYPEPANEGGSCDDSLFCNGMDTCVQGQCEHSGNPCVDSNCTEDDSGKCCTLNSYRACGSDGDVWSFDSCGNETTLLDDCADQHGVCQSGECRCTNNWSGENCDYCPERWDSEKDCNSCLSNWDSENDCESCRNAWDPTDGCYACLPGWTGDDCEVQTECIRYVTTQPAVTHPNGLSWITAYRSIQDAIDSAHEAVTLNDYDNIEKCEVWVAEGRYYVYRHSQDDSLQLKPKVNLLGGFVGIEKDEAERDWVANETILDGQIEDETARQSVLHLVIGSNDATLDGFTITNGRADRMNYPGDSGYYGAGVYNYQTSPLIQNCTFINNRAEGHNEEYSGGIGGAIYNREASPTIRNCVFIDNQSGIAGGAIYNEDSSPIIDNCNFVGNLAALRGEAIASAGGHITILNSFFRDNEVYTNSSTGIIRGGALSFETAQFRIENGAFIQNSVESYFYDTECQGGGIYAHDNGTSETIKHSIINCSFYGNHADNFGAAIFINTRNPVTVSNSIFWGNTQNGDLPETNSYYCSSAGMEPSILFSFIQEEEGATSPLFVDPTDGDLHLLPGSPCIDSGNNSLLPPDAFDIDDDDDRTEFIPSDIDGNDRIINGDVDMGAYEYQGI